MHTNNIAMPVYSHTSVEYGFINENVPGGSFFGLIYKMLTPMPMRSQISFNLEKTENLQFFTERSEW